MQCISGGCDEVFSVLRPPSKMLWGIYQPWNEARGGKNNNRCTAYTCCYLVK